MSMKQMKTLISLATEQGLEVESMTIKEFTLFAKSVKL